MLTGTERLRSYYFGSKDAKSHVPLLSYPFTRRNQESQGNTNMCTVFQYAEILENKVFWETGEWYRFSLEEIKRLWEKMKDMGIAGDKWGAYINSPLEASLDEKITLTQTPGNKKLQVRLKEWFPIASKLDLISDYLDAIKREMAYGGGCLSGLNNRISKLDYFSAGKSPYIIEKNKTGKTISHATCFGEFDDTGERKYIPENTIAMPGTWGNDFGDNGVVYLPYKSVKKLFVPLGFSLEYI